MYFFNILKRRTKIIVDAHAERDTLIMNTGSTVNNGCING